MNFVCHEPPLPDDKRARAWDQRLAPLKPVVEADGRHDFSSLWSGQGVGLVSIGTSTELVDRLAEDVLARLAEIPLTRKRAADEVKIRGNRDTSQLRR